MKEWLKATAVSTAKDFGGAALILGLLIAVPMAWVGLGSVFGWGFVPVAIFLLLFAMERGEKK